MTTIPSTTPSSTGTTTPTTTGSSQTQLNSDFNTFLKLLTTQLKNQDPTSPLDTNQFTQQLVGFSQVEQAINTNSKLDNLIALQSADQTLSGLALVGHTVQFTDNKVILANGTSQLGYTLPNDATQAIITITDSTGNVVYRGSGDTGAGQHNFTWDGKAADGSQLSDGVYTFNVAAQGSDGSAITATYNGFGVVSSVDVNNGQITANIGTLKESLGNIKAVSQ
jgi:flagellar basal-body rod modification protein FlgD